MWHKFLLVVGILLAGCSLGEDRGVVQSQAEPTKAMEADAASTQTSDSASQPTIQSQPPVPLSDLGPAPELTNDIWLNTEHPLRLADLRGTVVLLEMWTFG